MTYYQVRKDLPRLIRGGRNTDGTCNEELLVHATQTFGVALVFVPGMEGLTQIYRILEDASHVTGSNGRPFCDAGSFPQWDTVAKMARGDFGVSLESASRFHLWCEAFVKHAPSEPRFAQAVEAIKVVLGDGTGFRDNSFELCLHLLNVETSQSFRQKLAEKGAKAVSDVHAFSSAIFANADIPKSARKNVVFYLEQGAGGGRRDYRFSKATAQIIESGFAKLARDNDLPAPSNDDLFRYGGTEGKAAGRSTMALSRPNGNVIPRVA